MRNLLGCKGFREQGAKDTTLEEGTATILANIDSVGKHMCIWIQRTEDNWMVRKKTYNKIVSNFEAGDRQFEIQEATKCQRF